MTLDTEQVHAAALLYNLCDRMREEGKHKAHPSIKGTLANSIRQLEALAGLAARGTLDLDTADAYAEAGELTLRKIISIRKFGEALRHKPNRT